jgi:CDP-diacylglycerol pyrophosphatase
MRKRADTDIAHLLELPNLGRARVLGADVILVARCSRAKEHRRIMIVCAMSVAEERVAHETHGRSAKSRTLPKGRKGQRYLTRQEGAKRRAHSVLGKGIEGLVAEVDSPLLGRAGLSKVVAVEDNVVPSVSIKVVNGSL